MPYSDDMMAKARALPTWKLVSELIREVRDPIWMNLDDAAVLRNEVMRRLAHAKIDEAHDDIVAQMELMKTGSDALVARVEALETHVAVHASRIDEQLLRALAVEDRLDALEGRSKAGGPDAIDGLHCSKCGGPVRRALERQHFCTECAECHNVVELR